MEHKVAKMLACPGSFLCQQNFYNFISEIESLEFLYII
jgi:hypothetical protein